MSTPGKYRTIERISEGFYKEKGSKFYAFAVPCTTEDEIKNWLNGWRKEHYQAVHVCYAFRLGSDKKLFRASDDGEPSNSAGPPILGQIQSFDLTNILIGIVRYYGGTNLGVGGLINAYRTAAKDALEQAVIIEKEDQLLFELQFGYDRMPTVMSLIKSLPVAIREQQFELDCRLVATLPVSATGAIQQLKELSNVVFTEYGVNA